MRWKSGYNNHIYSFSYERLRNQTALSKHFWKLKNMGLTLKIQYKVLKRSTISSCFDGRCNFCLEENIQIMSYSDPGNLLNQRCGLIARCKLKNHHHPHVVQLARISLTLSRHFSLSFIASGRSSRLHPISPHSCCMYVRAGRPAFARPCVGVHRSASIISSSLLIQQCPACLVRLTWIVFVMGGRWPYSWCLVGCCR